MSVVYSYLGGKFHPTALEFGNHSIGEEWSSLTGVIPAGGVPYLGQLVSRALYADLWAYVQEKIPGKILSDSEWQSLHASQKGTVLAYSSGDGSTTFRMPAFTGYARGAATLDEAGTYVAEGLPGITGDNGNSTHVTPETGVALYGVYAVTTISPIGEATEVGILSAITTLEASNFVKSVNGVVADAAGNVGIGAGNDMPSSKYTDLTVGASGATYTAPANGWFVAQNELGNVSFLSIENNANKLGASDGMHAMNTTGIVSVPCLKGQTVTVKYSSSNNKPYLIRFVYAQGDA